MTMQWAALLRRKALRLDIPKLLAGPLTTMALAKLGVFTQHHVETKRPFFPEQRDMDPATTASC